MRIEADRLFISDVDEYHSGYPIVIEDVRTGKQNLVVGRGCFKDESADPDALWEGDLDAYIGTVFLYDDEKDSLEAFYDTIDRGFCKSEFPRVVTKADQKQRKKAEAAERRRQKRREASKGSRAAKNKSSSSTSPGAHTLEGLRVMNVSEVADDES